MKTLLTGAVHSYADTKSLAVLESKRRTREGAVVETFYLKFHSDEAYREFKGRYALGTGVQVMGLMRQIQTPLLDRVSKQPLIGTNGRELRNAVLSVEVREHKPLTSGDEFDTLYVHGLVGVVEKREMRQSAAGLAVLKLRVAYNHYKRAGEDEGQGDFYNVVAFGPQAESLNNLEKGEKFILDHGVPSLDTYELRDTTHADGTAVMRNGLEIALREFTYLPRSRRQSGPLPALQTPSYDEIPF